MRRVKERCIITTIELNARLGCSGVFLSHVSVIFVILSVFLSSIIFGSILNVLTAMNVTYQCAHHYKSYISMRLER